MSNRSPLVRALLDLSVYDELDLTLEDTRQIEATVTVLPSYQPFDPTGRRTQGGVQVRCTATRETYDRLSLPSALLMLDAIERRVWEPPVVSVYDPATEPVEGGLTRIIENRWQVLDTLIGIDY